MYENLLNSPARGNLVDGLPRAASSRYPMGGRGQNYLIFFVTGMQNSQYPVIRLGWRQFFPVL